MPTDLNRLAIPLAVGAGLLSLVLWYYATRPAKKLLDKVRKRLKVTKVTSISDDTKIIQLSTGEKNTVLGLPTGKHVHLFCPNPEKSAVDGKWNGKDCKEKGETEIKRSYTPTSSDTPGYVELVVKVYRPGTVTLPDGRSMTWEDGGKMGLHLDSLKVGDHLELNGPFGHIEYLGKGSFKKPGSVVNTKHVAMMAGGSGITPMLQVLQHAVKEKADDTKFSLIYANKTEGDILMKDMLDDLERQGAGRIKIHYTLDFPPEGWNHKKGFITADMIKDCLPAEASKNPLFLMCGPPPMIEFACKKNLESLGFEKKSYIEF